MQLSTLLHAEEWVQETFGQANLGDPRRLRRLLQMAVQIAKRPWATLPKQMQGMWADLKGADRFLHDQAISFQALAEPVWQQTREQANSGNEPVLLVQDTTEIDYGYDPQISGLGPLLQLRDLQHLQADQPVAGLLPPEEAWLVAHLSHIQEDHLTMGTFLVSVARLGGFLGRTSDGWPGWQSLWDGWWQLQPLLQGMRLAAQAPPFLLVGN